MATLFNYRTLFFAPPYTCCPDPSDFLGSREALRVGFMGQLLRRVGARAAQRGYWRQLGRLHLIDANGPEKSGYWKSHGERQPMADNSSEAERAVNRLIEIFLAERASTKN